VRVCERIFSIIFNIELTFENFYQISVEVQEKVLSEEGGGVTTWMGGAWEKLLNVGSKVLLPYIPGKNSQKSAAYYIY